MDYSEEEKSLLTMMDRSDFKNLSKADLLNIASKISELPPEVASNVLAQFPEYVQLLQSEMTTYKEILGDIISSDDESLRQEFEIASHDQEVSAKSREQFYDFAKIIHSDISKCLDKEDLTPDQMDSLLNRDMEILRILSEKDTEIRQHETETVQMVDKKDSEKREYNWNLIRVASGVLVAGVAVGGAILGVKIKIPKKIL